MNWFRRRSQTNPRGWKSPAATTLLTLLLSAGCAGTDNSTEAPSVEATPAERSVRIETTGCGSASGRTGSGIVIEDDAVVTVAHLVVRADGVSANVGASGPIEAKVTAVDLERDLALLRIEPTGFDRVPMAGISGETSGTGFVIGAAVSGTLPYTIERPARISIEEVLGETRHERLGYELDAITEMGDSGAGLYDDEERLIGMVFATSDEGTTTWATASSEIQAFFNGNRFLDTPLSCDQSSSRLSGV